MRHILPLFLLACNDYQIQDVSEEKTGNPAIQVDPDRLDYGVLEEGASLSKSFVITSVGDTTLSITDMKIEGSGTFTFLSGNEAVDLEPEASVEVEVVFTSAGSSESGEVIISSDAKGQESTTVELSASAAGPELTIDPSSIDFGAVDAGDTEDVQVLLINTGVSVLTVTEFDLPTAPFGLSWSASLPFVIDPGGSVELTASFEPTTGGSFSETLWFVSDDPAGDRSLELTASSTASQPVALCSVSPSEVATLREDATWIGDTSYDPAGRSIVDYDWTLISIPSGSTATMPSGGANRSNFTTDMAGTYVGQLIVTNDQGISSEPCTVELESVPAEDLWIEMFWNHSNDDMDLHLLAPGGSLETNQDCYYANCVYGGLNWGDPGSSDDNPSLDLDDIYGTGPENINIGSPDSGDYTVYVHDYPYTGTYSGGNDVTVNIYISGALVWSDTRTISGENSYTPFAEISYPAGSVTSL